tara:strand:+ start:26219 stop:26848 length:630 start_codon:yes stop_codon:yes gene_type:complete
MYALFFSFLWGCGESLNKNPTDLPVEIEVIEEEEEEPFEFEVLPHDVLPMYPGIQASADCGQFVGQKPCNIILEDQNGEWFQLYDHVGKVILLDFSTGWCGPCIRAAGTVQEIQDLYEDEGFIYVTIMIEDNQQNETTTEFIQQWATTYGIVTAPILIGSRDLIDYNSIEGWNLISWPTFYIIDRDMKIHSGIRGYSEELIHQEVQEVI